MMSVLSVRCIMCAGMYVRMQLVGNASMSGYVRRSKTHCIPRGRPVVKWSQEGAENKT